MMNTKNNSMSRIERKRKRRSWEEWTWTWTWPLDSCSTRRWNSECRDDIECHWCCPRSRWCRPDNAHSTTWSRSRWTTAADRLRSWASWCCSWASTDWHSSRSRWCRGTTASCRTRSMTLRISRDRPSNGYILHQPRNFTTTYYLIVQKEGSIFANLW